MMDNHIGYTQWSIPDKNRNPMTFGMKIEHPLTTPVSTTEIGIPAYQYSRMKEGKNAKWIFLPDLGRGKGCMGIDHVMAASELDGKGASLEYDFALSSDMQQLAIALGILPTQDVYPSRGLRIGVQIDDQPLPQQPKLALNGWWKGKRQLRRDEVFDNQRWLAATSSSAVKAGKHKLRVVMIDPEIVLEQVVVNPDNSRYSYFGQNL